MATDAKVRIVAENATAAAFAQVSASLRSLDRHGRQLTTMFKGLGGVLIGRELVRGVKEVFEITGKANPEFANMLKQIKSEAAGLLDGSSGVPAATASLRELSGVLNDPTARAAAQQLAGSILEIGAAGASVAAQFAGGLGLMIFGPSQRSLQIDDELRGLKELEAQLQATASASQGFGASLLASAAAANSGGLSLATMEQTEASKKLLEVRQKIVALEKEYWAAIDAEGKALRDSQAQEKKLRDQQAAEAARRNNEARARQVEADNAMTRTALEKDLQSWNEFYAALERLRQQNAISEDVFLDRYSERLDSVLSEVTVTAKPIERRTKDEDPFADFKSEGEDFGQVFDPLIAAGDRAAANLQGVFENFFFDPMDDGFKGMLRGFVNTLRQMVAEAAAAQLMKALGFGGSGGGGIFGDILGALVSGFGGGSWSGSWSDGYVSAGGNLGFASGGSFKVGGHGGTDSKMVAFRATPGELVDIRRPGQAAGTAMPALNVSYNIDARGATQDLVRALPEILARNNDALKSDIITGIRRGKYAV